MKVNHDSIITTTTLPAQAIPPKPEPELSKPDLLIKDPQVNINPDDNSQNAAPEEEREFIQPRSKPSLPDSEDPSVAIDWNPDEAWQTRFWVRIMEERKQRQHSARP